MDNIETEKIGKLVAMAKGGYLGEKQNAISILKKICKKHNLSFDEIMQTSDELKIEEYSIKYKTKIEFKLIIQILCSYWAETEEQLEEVYSNKYYKSIFFKTTKAKYIEIVYAVEIFLSMYHKERKKILDAVYFGFLDKHNLYSPFNTNANQKISKKESELRDVGARLAGSMEDINIRKALKSGV